MDTKITPLMRTTSGPSAKMHQFSSGGPRFNHGLPYHCMHKFPSPHMCDFVTPRKYEFTRHVCGFSLCMCESHGDPALFS